MDPPGRSSPSSSSSINNNHNNYDPQSSRSPTPTVFPPWLAKTISSLANGGRASSPRLTFPGSTSGGGDLMLEETIASWSTATTTTTAGMMGRPQQQDWSQPLAPAGQLQLEDDLIVDEWDYSMGASPLMYTSTMPTATTVTPTSTSQAVSRRSSPTSPARRSTATATGTHHHASSQLQRQEINGLLKHAKQVANQLQALVDHDTPSVGMPRMRILHSMMVPP